MQHIIAFHREWQKTVVANGDGRNRWATIKAETSVGVPDARASWEFCKYATYEQLKNFVPEGKESGQKHQYDRKKLTQLEDVCVCTFLIKKTEQTPVIVL